MVTANKLEQPREGELVQLVYEINQGVAAQARGEAAGVVSEILTDDDGKFRGFKIMGDDLRVCHNPNLQGISLKANRHKGKVDIYGIFPDRKYKINAIPGAVSLNPDDYGRDDAKREPVK